MMKKFNSMGSLRSQARCFFAFLLSIGLAACISVPDCYDDSPHPGLVVFGDSYSDTGNIVIDDSIPFPEPPFFEGRFSNGLVAVDHLANHLGIQLKPSLHTVSCRSGYNYAVGGGNIVGPKRQDFTEQVDCYLKRVDDVADPLALYVVMLGGNDVRSMNVGLSDLEAKAEIDEILDVLFAQVNRLIDAGAVRFLIANSGDMGRLPGSIADLGAAPNRLSEYSNMYNLEFDVRFANLASTSPGLTKFDLFNTMKGVLDNPTVHSFNNVDEACFTFDRLPNQYHVDCGIGLIDTFVFLDSVHATAKTQKIIGDAMFGASPPP